MSKQSMIAPFATVHRRIHDLTAGMGPHPSFLSWDHSDKTIVAVQMDVQMESNNLRFEMDRRTEVDTRQWRVSISFVWPVVCTWDVSRTRSREFPRELILNLRRHGRATVVSGNWKRIVSFVDETSESPSMGRLAAECTAALSILYWFCPFWWCPLFKAEVDCSTLVFSLLLFLQMRVSGLVGKGGPFSISQLLKLSLWSWFCINDCLRSSFCFGSHRIVYIKSCKLGL